MALPPGPLVRSTAADAIAAVVAAGGDTAVPPPLRWDPERHARSRFGYGPTLADTVAAAAPGASFDPDRWWADQVALGRQYPAFSGVPGLTDQVPSLGLPPDQMIAYSDAHSTQPHSLPATELEIGVTVLKTWSPAQLFESVVEAVAGLVWVPNIADGPVRMMRSHYEAAVIRANAFGSFTDVLLGSARHPAMLWFLDNYASQRYAPNENYGRELLELHTVGRDAGYTLTDVQNSARILTGRTVDPTTYLFSWRPEQHWMGPVKAFGFKNANSNPLAGLAMGDKYLRYLATHPRTAARVAGKLCQRFVSDTPSADLVAAVAAALQSSGNDILTAVSTIYRSTEFWASRGAKTRRPAENIIAAARGLGVTPVDVRSAGSRLASLIDGVGDAAYGALSPAGYPDVASAWDSAGAVVGCWRAQRSLATVANPTAIAGPTSTDLLGPTPPATVGDAIDALGRRLRGSAPTPAVAQTLLTFAQEFPSRPYDKSRLKNLTPSSAALLLHAPDHALR